MSTTVQDRQPLLVIRTRVLWVPVDEILDEILGPCLGDPDLVIRDETIDPERVLEARQADSAEDAAEIAKAMLEAYPEVGDRQRIKIVSAA